MAGVDTPDVAAWAVTRAGRTEVEVLLRVGPRELVGRLTREELARVTDVLDAAVAAERRNDYSRVRLGDGLRAAIGRDPFRSPGRVAAEGEAFLPWWRALVFLVLGAGFALRHLDDWWQLFGWSVVAVALTDLVQHGLWWHRRRLR